MPSCARWPTPSTAPSSERPPAARALACPPSQFSPPALAPRLLPSRAKPNRPQPLPPSFYSPFCHRPTVFLPRPTTQVIFTLNGETGKSVSQYAAQWNQLVPVVRSWLMAGGKVARDKALIAVSLNYNKL
jgi:hypothetical protein